jgi:hypothetical protein
VRSKCRCSCVLQFTFRHAVSCVLHRPSSQVIHCAVLSFSMHSSLVKVTKFEKCNCLHIPSQGGKGSFETREEAEIVRRLVIPSVQSSGHRTSSSQATGRHRDLDSLLRPLAVWQPAADGLPAHEFSPTATSTDECSREVLESFSTEIERNR